MINKISNGMNNTTIEKVQKVTSQGQITLPVRWRRKFGSNQVILRSKGNILEVSPLNLSICDDEYTVFDAIRDNKGKGVKSQDLLKILKKIDK